MVSQAECAGKHDEKSRGRKPYSGRLRRRILNARASRGPNSSAAPAIRGFHRSGGRNSSWVTAPITKTEGRTEQNVRETEEPVKREAKVLTLGGAGERKGVGRPLDAIQGRHPCSSPPLRLQLHTLERYRYNPLQAVRASLNCLPNPSPLAGPPTVADVSASGE